MSDDPLERATGKAIEEAAKVAGKFLDRVAGEASDELGGLFGDRVRFWRAKQRINLILKFKAFLDAMGVEPRRIAPSILVPLIESGSLAAPDLQEAWAAMLAHAADPNSRVEVTETFPRILEQLSPLDVRVLDWLLQRTAEIAPGHQGYVEAHAKLVQETFGFSEKRYQVVAGNLARLGLIDAQYYSVTRSGGSRANRVHLSLRLTPLGIEFVEACKYPQLNTALRIDNGPR